MTQGTILILGATSAIARGSAEEFAKRGHPLILASRDIKELSRIASDLQIRFNVPVSSLAFHAEDTSSHPAFFNALFQNDKEIAGALIAFGELGGKIHFDNFTEQEKTFRINFIGAASALSQMASLLSKKRKGFLIGITSVAGERGRQSNFVYGAAKGALAIYLEGLRNKLYHEGVHVMTVKPGFVDTAMTFGLPGMFLIASPKDVGKKIVSALDRKRNVVYIPGFWRGIMAIIRAIPEALFKRLRL